LMYNETQSDAFKNLSNDTQSIILGISKKINKNIDIGLKSNLKAKRSGQFSSLIYVLKSTKT